MSERPACLVVADALAPEQRRHIEERWGEINPHYAGAPTADILDILYDADAHLDVREPMFEEHGDLWTKDLSAATTSMIVLASIMLMPELSLKQRVTWTRTIQERILDATR